MTALRKKTQAQYDILTVGELLVELNNTKLNDNLSQATEFKRLMTGSPAYLASNMLKLGNTAIFVAAIGKDNLGVFLTEQLEKEQVGTQFLITATHTPTSLILTNRSQSQTEYAVYRQADLQLRKEHLPDSLIKKAHIFHTTAVALSQRPAQATILEAAQRAYNQSITVSIDMNFAPEFWESTNEAQKILQQFCQTEPLIKLSTEDAYGLFGQQYGNELDIIATLHAWGARMVCLTMGREGSMVSDRQEKQFFNLASHKVKKILDTVGAGDAFWAGFLSAWLDEQPLTICTQAGSKLAALKLQRVGSLPMNIDKNRLYK